MSEKKFGRFVNWPKKHRITGANNFIPRRGYYAGLKAAADLRYDSFEFMVLNAGEASDPTDDEPVMSGAGWD